MDLHHRPGWRRFVASPHYATVTTVSGAIAGLLGSVYGTDIADAFPLRLRPPFRLSLHAVSFWVSLIVFAVLFYYRQRHDDTARARLEGASDRITSLVQTLPPKAFRAQFAKAADATHSAHGVNILGPAPERREIFQALLTPVLLDLAEAVAIYSDLDPAVKRALAPEPTEPV